MYIVLFDIDGTLIDTCGCGLQSLRSAFTDVFRRTPPARIDTCGRTDRGIARAMFRSESIEDSHSNWTAFHTAYLRHLEDQLPLREGRILPGVPQLIDAMQARDDVAVGLLTGNTPAGARVKLEHFGIFHHFSFGGFGDKTPERNAVAESALAAARERFNGRVDPSRVWVVGDTPLDIECARHVGANVVAVATGQFQREQLEQAAPDLLLDDLSDAAGLLGQMDGTQP